MLKKLSWIVAFKRKLPMEEAITLVMIQVEEDGFVADAAFRLTPRAAGNRILRSGFDLPQLVPAAIDEKPPKNPRINENMHGYCLQ